MSPREPFVPLTLAEFVAPPRAALVMWDMQKGLAGKALHTERIQANAHRLLAAAAAAGVPVIWSRHVLPPLELIPAPFVLFLMKKQKVDHPGKLQPTMRPGMEETEFLDGFAPAPDDLVFEKSQPSLFVDTPVRNRLQTLGVETLVLAGVATDIEFTARHAAACGYHSVVVEDASGSYTDEAHQRSIAFLRGWTTPVVTTDDVCRLWLRASEGRTPQRA
jgi:nicotinamidase-related amidase